MANKSVTANTVHTVGTGTISALTVTSAATIGRISLHDCASPDQAAAHNEIWPRGAGGTLTFKQGLVVHCTDPNGAATLSITTL